MTFEREPDLKEFKSANDAKPGCRCASQLLQASCRVVTPHATASGPETQVALPQSHQAHTHQHGSGIAVIG